MQNLDYLLANSEAWLQYAIKTELLGETKENLADLRAQALQDTKIASHLNDVSNFHSVIVSGHKNPDLPINKLLFLLDIGLEDTQEVRYAISEILEHRDKNGVYQSAVNVPKHFGGTGEDTFGWALCDAPLLLLALVKANVDYENHIKQGVAYLASLYQSAGFPCAVSGELGKFRGPGRKADCCPFATLIMLKLFSEIPEYRDGELAAQTVERLLSLWENSLEIHPYMFYMGKDFRKLKAPAVWYDIVSVAEVLSRFDCAKKDERFLEMLAIIKEKQDEKGLFTPESIYQKCSAWDFGQKKAPSSYLTFLCLRIFQRMEI